MSTLPTQDKLIRGRLSWKADLRELLVIAGANVASTITISIMSFTDFWIVSQLPNGTAAQAAVSSGGLVFFTLFGLLLGIMFCTTTVVSQSLGAGRDRDCSAYAWQGIWISLMAGLASLPLWLLVPSVFAWIGHAPEVQLLEVEYTRIRLLSFGLAGAMVSMSHYFIGIHRPWQDTVSAVAANGVNIFLTWGLVMGAWGLPEIGFAGAAWGTLLATAFRMIWLLIIMCYGPTAERFQARQTWRWDPEKARRLLHVGWPSGVTFVIDIGAWAVFMVGIIGMFGTIHLAATASVWRFTELSFMPAIGIGIAVSTMVGKAIGQGRFDLARQRAWMGTAINMAYMSVMGVIYIFGGRELMQFVTEDPAVIAIGIEVLIFAAIFQIFDAVAITHSHALRGAGDTRWPAVVGGLEAWVIMIGGGYLTARYWPELGSKGPWFFATLFVNVIGITLWIRWRRGAWEKIDVIGRHDVLPDVAPEPDAGPVPLEVPYVQGEEPVPVSEPVSMTQRR